MAATSRTRGAATLSRGRRGRHWRPQNDLRGGHGRALLGLGNMGLRVIDADGLALSGTVISFARWALGASGAFTQSARPGMERMDNCH